MATLVDFSDLQSHYYVWRRALEAKYEAAEPATHDTNDKAYWTHELEVFDKTIGKAAAEITRLQAELTVMEDSRNGYARQDEARAVEYSRLQAELDAEGKREVKFEGAIELLEKIAYSIAPDYAAYVARQYLNQHKAAVEAAALSAICGEQG